MFHEVVSVSEDSAGDQGLCPQFVIVRPITNRIHLHYISLFYEKTGPLLATIREVCFICCICKDFVKILPQCIILHTSYYIILYHIIFSNLESLLTKADASLVNFGYYLKKYFICIELKKTNMKIPLGVFKLITSESTKDKTRYVDV